MIKDIGKQGKFFRERTKSIQDVVKGVKLVQEAPIKQRGRSMNKLALREAIWKKEEEDEKRSLSPNNFPTISKVEVNFGH